jgi:hypothetical protein
MMKSTKPYEQGKQNAWERNRNVCKVLIQNPEGNGSVGGSGGT